MTFDEELVGLRPRLLLNAHKLLRGAEGAEDLVQDTIVKALTYRHQFEAGTRLSAWTFTIMRNLYYTAGRRSGRVLEDPDEHHTNGLAGPDDQHIRVEFLDTITTIKTLPKAMQEALYLVGLLGHEYHDVADMLDVNVGTIKSRVSRARTKLEKKLA